FFILHKSSKKNAFILCVLLMIGAFLPILPVTIHNYKASGEFILLTANTGINFYYGANKDAAPTFTRRESVSDSIEEEEQKAREKAETAMGRKLSPKEVSSYWMKRGFDEITGNFGKWFSYEISKLYWSINTYEIPNNYNLSFEKRNVPTLKLFFVPFGVISLLGLLGIIIAPKKDHKVLLLLFYLLSLFIGLMTFTVVGRFRIPLTVILAGFAGYGITEYISLLKNRNYNIEASKKYLAATIAVIILAIPTLIPYRQSTNPASTYYTLGILAFREGKYEQAIEYQRSAISTYPSYTEAYNNIASCYKKMGDLDKALENYEKASEFNPDYAESRFNAGLVYMEKEDYPNAIKKFNQALEINPKYIKAKVNLSFALFRNGSKNEAIKISNELIQMDPENAVNHYNLGLMLSQTGDYEGARKHFQTAIDLDENYEDAKSALVKLNKKKPENIPAN
ncbi:tetratricopeptide repeat protein, partial [bacterium]|nr:tetratricopeptide repeat protein [bacterium]MBU1024545.1 tetratricopeptide repeat protein [bacterium]